MRNLRLLLVLLTCFYSLPAAADMLAVILDRDGYTNVRSKPSVRSAIVGRVLDGEIFEFHPLVDRDEPTAWVGVKLKSGKTGFMHGSRVIHYSSIEMLADTESGDEASVFAQRKGIAYYPVARAAAGGDLKALETLFSLGIPDGGWGEPHVANVRTVVALLGDEEMAAFCRMQPSTTRDVIRDTLITDRTFEPFDDEAYLKRVFPKTAAALAE